MYILTATQNAQVIMKVYYAHCYWLMRGGYITQYFCAAVMVILENAATKKRKVTQLIEERVKTQKFIAAILYYNKK